MENISEIKDRIIRDVSEIETQLWSVMKGAVEDRDKAGIENSKRAIDRWTKIAQDVKDFITELDTLSMPSEGTPLIIKIKEESTGLKIIELNGKTHNLKNLYEVLIIVANYILEVSNGLPIINNFVHKREEDFTMSSKKIKKVGDYYIEVGDDKERIIKKCKLLLEASVIGKYHLFRITKDGQKIKV